MRDRGPILGLALGLVVCTVLGMGLFIHWLIPPVSLPVAFALAAIISPTDPVAVSAITARVPLPAPFPQRQPADDLEERQEHQRRHHAGEDDAEHHRDAGAENHAPEALALR